MNPAGESGAGPHIAEGTDQPAPSPLFTHSKFVKVTSRASRCDFCEERNRLVAQACKECFLIICRPCFLAGKTDRFHDYSSADLDWTPEKLPDGNSTGSKRNIKAPRRLRRRPLEDDDDYHGQEEAVVVADAVEADQQFSGKSSSSRRLTRSHAKSSGSRSQLVREACAFPVGPHGEQAIHAFDDERDDSEEELHTKKKRVLQDISLDPPAKKFRPLMGTFAPPRRRLAADLQPSHQHVTVSGPGGDQAGPAASGHCADAPDQDLEDGPPAVYNTQMERGESHRHRNPSVSSRQTRLDEASPVESGGIPDGSVDRSQTPSGIMEARPPPPFAYGRGGNMYGGMMGMPGFAPWYGEEGYRPTYVPHSQLRGGTPVHAARYNEVAPGHGFVPYPQPDSGDGRHPNFPPSRFHRNQPGPQYDVGHGASPYQTQYPGFVGGYGNQFAYGAQLPHHYFGEPFYHPRDMGGYAGFAGDHAAWLPSAVQNGGAAQFALPPRQVGNVAGLDGQHQSPALANQEGRQAAAKPSQTSTGARAAVADDYNQGATDSMDDTISIEDGGQQITAQADNQLVDSTQEGAPPSGVQVLDLENLDLDLFNGQSDEADFNTGHGIGSRASLLASSPRANLTQSESLSRIKQRRSMARDVQPEKTSNEPHGEPAAVPQNDTHPVKEDTLEPARHTSHQPDLLLMRDDTNNPTKRETVDDAASRTGRDPSTGQSSDPPLLISARSMPAWSGGDYNRARWIDWIEWTWNNDPSLAAAKAKDGTLAALREFESGMALLTTYERGRKVPVFPGWVEEQKLQLLRGSQ